MESTDMNKNDLNDEVPNKNPSLEQGQTSSEDSAGDVAVTTVTKQSLNSVHGNRQGFLHALSLILNACLMVYAHVGLSAVILSNQQRIEIDNTSIVQEPTTTNTTSQLSPDTNLTESCTMEDLTIWNTGGNVNKTRQSNWCAREYQGNGCLLTKDCYVDCFVNVYHYTTSCARCFAEIPFCSFNEGCAFICQADGESEECDMCTLPCNQIFDSCSGLPRPEVTFTNRDTNNENIAIITTNNTSVVSVESIESSEEICARQQEGVDLEDVEEYYVVYKIMFFAAVKTAWTSDARLLAVIVVLFSGIWPYAKNILLAVVWFLPLTIRRRDWILTWLRRLGKYTLVDIYIVILLMEGMSLQINVADNVPVIIKAEPRPALVAFLLATIWEFVQIEIMVSLHDKQCNEKDHKGKIQRTVPKWFRNGIRGSSRSIYLSLVLLWVVTVGLFVAGSTTEVIRFTSIVGGETEGCPRIYNLYDIGTMLISDSFLTENNAKPAVWTLFFAFMLFLIVFPLCCHVVHALVFFFKLQERRLCTLADMMWTFASIEILALALFTVEYKFDELIAALAGNEGAAFFGLESKLGPGFSILIAYSVFAGLLHSFFNMGLLLRDGNYGESS